MLLTARFGPRICAQVAEVVGLEVESKKYSKMTAAAKEVAAIRYGNSTANSITNYLSSPVFRKRPKLVHKNIKAATVEAAEVAAKVEAAARIPGHLLTRGRAEAETTPSRPFPPTPP